ncbi:hypothetical protein ACJ2A9_10695 [Anaerobacillus sp. MEB173]|uniref:hypothetical protein n=1 Tax=Anaerobacillus sp. MEB173 TaxID=3383345 RepID=UPI003F91C5B2
MSMSVQRDQAEKLHHKMEELVERAPTRNKQQQTLEPKSRVERKKLEKEAREAKKRRSKKPHSEEKSKQAEKKRPKFKVQFLLVRVLLFLFLLLIGVVVTYPLWSDKYPIL